MKIKKLRLVRNERFLHIQRYSRIVGSKDRHDISLSKARHPSKAVLLHRQQTDMEENRDQRVD